MPYRTPFSPSSTTSTPSPASLFPNTSTPSEPSTLKPSRHSGPSSTSPVILSSILSIITIILSTILLTLQTTLNTLLSTIRTTLTSPPSFRFLLNLALSGTIFHTIVGLIISFDSAAGRCAYFDGMWGREEGTFQDVLSWWMRSQRDVIVAAGARIMVASGLALLVWLSNEKGDGAGGWGTIESGDGMAQKNIERESIGRVDEADDAAILGIKSPRYTPRRGIPMGMSMAGRGVPLTVFTHLNVLPNEPSCGEDEDKCEYEDVPDPLDTDTVGSACTREESGSNTSSASSDTGNNISDYTSSTRTSSNASDGANASPTHSLKRARSSDSNASDASNSCKRHHSSAGAEEQSLDATTVVVERASTAEHDGRVGRAGVKQDVGSDDDDGSEDDGDDEEGIEDDVQEDIEDDVEDDPEENESEYDAEDDGDDWSEDGSECDSPDGWAVDYAGDVIMFDVDNGVWLEY